MDKNLFDLLISLILSCNVGITTAENKRDVHIRMEEFNSANLETGKITAYQNVETWARETLRLDLSIESTGHLLENWV